MREGKTWQQEATAIGEVSRETAWEAASTMVQGSGEGKVMVAREQGRGREKKMMKLSHMITRREIKSGHKLTT